MNSTKFIKLDNSKVDLALEKLATQSTLEELAHTLTAEIASLQEKLENYQFQTLQNFAKKEN